MKHGWFVNVVVPLAIKIKTRTSVEDEIDITTLRGIEA